MEIQGKFMAIKIVPILLLIMSFYDTGLSWWLGFPLMLKIQGKSICLSRVLVEAHDVFI